MIRINKLIQCKFAPYIIIWIFSLIASLAFSLCPFLEFNIGTDSSVFLTIAREISEGGIIYKDFFDHKGPLLYLIDFIGLQLFGFYGVGYLEIISLFIAMIFSYKTVNLILKHNIFSLLIVCISYSFLFTYISRGNLVEEYALPFISIGMYIFTKVFYENFNAKKSQAFILGITMAATLLLRPNMFGLWVSFCIVLLISYIRNKKVKELIVLVSFFIIGLATFILPFMVYLIYNNAFDQFVYQYLLFNSKYSATDSLFTLIKYIFINFSHYFSEIMVSVSSIFILVSLLMKQEEKFSLYNIALFFSMISTVLLLSVSRETYGHYSLVFLPLIAPSFAMFVKNIRLNNLKIDTLFRKIIICIIIIVFCFANIFNYLNAIVQKSSISFVKEVSEYIENNSNEDDEIIVLGNSCQIYLYSDRSPASKYLYQSLITDYDEDIKIEFEEDILDATPVFIVSKEILTEESEFAQIYTLVEEKYDEPYIIGDYILYELKGE